MNAHINTICTHVQIYTYGFACACVHLYPQHADTRHTSSAALTTTPCSNQRVTSAASPRLAASRIACSSAVRGRRAAGGVSGGDGAAGAGLAEAVLPAVAAALEFEDEEEVLAELIDDDGKIGRAHV